MKVPISSKIEVTVTPDRYTSLESVTITDQRGNSVYSGTDKTFTFETSDTATTYVINAKTEAP